MKQVLKQAPGRAIYRRPPPPPHMGGQNQSRGTLGSRPGSASYPGVNPTNPAQQGGGQQEENDGSGSPPPWDMGDEQAIAGAGRDRDMGLSNLDGSELATQQEYGYGEGYRPGDPFANPFSRAVLLQRSYDFAQQGSQTSYAAAGQYYSGAYGRIRDYNTFNYLQGDDASRREYAAKLAAIQAQRLGINNDYADAVAGARGDEISNAQDDPSQQYDPNDVPLGDDNKNNPPKPPKPPKRLPNVWRPRNHGPLRPQRSNRGRIGRG